MFSSRSVATTFSPNPSQSYLMTEPTLEFCLHFVHGKIQETLTDIGLSRRCNSGDSEDIGGSGDSDSERGVIAVK